MATLPGDERFSRRSPNARVAHTCGASRKHHGVGYLTQSVVVNPGSGAEAKVQPYVQGGWFLDEEAPPRADAKQVQAP